MRIVSYEIYSDNKIIYTCVSYQEMLRKEKEFKEQGIHNVWHQIALENIVSAV